MFENLFKSKEEIKKQSEEYKMKMFPLGDSQKDLAILAIRDLISKKVYENELMFYFIVSKQKYMEENGDLLKIYKYLKKRKIFKDEEIKAILACVVLDINAKSIEEYPTKEMVMEKMSTFSLN